MLLRPPTRSPLRLPTAPPIFDVATESLLDRMTTVPGSKRQNAIDTLIRSLKAAGSWAKMDALYVFAAHDAQAALLNWVSTSYNLSVGAGAPAFTANSHYLGDGVADWLDTGFNPTTASSPKLVQDSGHMFAWFLTNLALSGPARSPACGNTNSCVTRHATASGGTTMRVNRSSLNSSATVSIPGHTGWTRSAAGLWELWGAGADIGGGTDASTALTNANFRVLASGGENTFGNNQIRFVHWGSNLSAAEVLATYNALSTYAGSL